VEVEMEVVMQTLEWNEMGMHVDLNWSWARGVSAFDGCDGCVLRMGDVSCQNTPC